MANINKLRLALLEAGIPHYIAAHMAGLSETVFSRIVVGRRVPTPDERARIAEALQRSEAELFADTTRQNASSRRSA
ncbi:MAG: helix-turn-helix transcriptional regulator [Polyangia bacterium]